MDTAHLPMSSVDVTIKSGCQGASCPLCNAGGQQVHEKRAKDGQPEA